MTELEQTPFRCGRIDNGNESKAVVAKDDQVGCVEQKALSKVVENDHGDCGDGVVDCNRHERSRDRDSDKKRDRNSNKGRD